jgi:hypothetical protein
VKAARKLEDRKLCVFTKLTITPKKFGLWLSIGEEKE